MRTLNPSEKQPAGDFTRRAAPDFPARLAGRLPRHRRCRLPVLQALSPAARRRLYSPACRATSQRRRRDFPCRRHNPTPIASPLLHVPKARFTASKRRLSSLLVLSATLRTEPRQEFSPCQSMSKKMSVQFSRCQCRRSAMLLPFGETAQEAVRLGAVRPVKCCYAAGSATQSVA